MPRPRQSSRESPRRAMQSCTLRAMSGRMFSPPFSVRVGSSHFSRSSPASLSRPSLTVVPADVDTESVFHKLPHLLCVFAGIMSCVVGEGTCPARRCIGALKWHWPPNCRCEEAAGRRGALSAKREEVPLGCNLRESTADWSRLSLNGMHRSMGCSEAVGERLCRGSLNRWRALVHRRTPLMCHCEERSDVAISQYRSG